MEKRHTFGVRILIPIITGAIGILFLSLGFGKYGFWHEMRGPLPGFFPSIIGIMLVGMSILAGVQAVKDPRKPIPFRNWLPAIGALAIIIASLIIGMLPAIALFLILWIRVYEKYPWKTTIITSSVIMAIVVGVFMFWLRVPFPKGFILDALAY